MDTAHHGNEAAWADGVIAAHPAVVVGVVARPEKVLGARELQTLVDHHSATLHPDWVAVVQLTQQVPALRRTLNTGAQEVIFLVEYYLEKEQKTTKTRFWNYFYIKLHFVAIEKGCLHAHAMDWQDGPVKKEMSWLVKNYLKIQKCN